MDLDVILTKTALARELLQRRDTLPRSQRLFLIMVDGRKSMRDLSEAAIQLGIDGSALATLANAGLIKWSREATSSDRAQPASKPAPPPAARSVPLVAVKLYAMDLVALMLPGQDHALRDAARDVGDADGLRTWLMRCADEIAQRNDRDRAELFRARVASQLPLDFFDQTSAPFISSRETV